MYSETPDIVAFTSAFTSELLTQADRAMYERKRADQKPLLKEANQE